MNKSIDYKQVFVKTVGAVMLAALAASPVLAAGEQGSEGAYWTNPEGAVWTNPAGDCWYNPNAPKLEKRKECGDVVAEAEPPAQVVTKTKRFNLEARALFGFDEATLRPEGKAQIRKLSRQIDAAWEIERIRVLGYTDKIGSERYNQGLSERRAQSVADYMNTLPISKYPTSVVGLGESQPRVTCHQDNREALIECLQPNRRVVIEVVGKKTVTETKE